ncbi:MULTISPECIES: hypothetical protein [Microbacterium]|uniref:MGH1-like glycoside hydrolase domain-containing protein n=1 Tax=Microbacterium TaxID=33882 RepID=UPI00146A5B67|nr:MULTISPECIES: hypothetical protein [Microbacterium]
MRDEQTLAASISGASILTPDSRIDDANEWAKINAIRVQHEFATGAAFTNNPPQDIAVVRDIAWFVLGAALFSTDFAARLLEFVAQYGVEPAGDITEFMRSAVDPQTDPPARGDHLAMTFHGVAHRTEDFSALVSSPPFDGFRDGYALTVKDDTPLFIIAVAAHYRVARDPIFLGRILPTVVAAAEYLLDQRRADGLFYAESARYIEPTNVWGLATWRNIINGYQILGATTEINSLIAQALDDVGYLLEASGHAQAGSWRDRASELRGAINAELWSSALNSYALTKTGDGMVRQELTSDVVFPLLFGAAEGDRAKAVADLLTSPRVQAPAGARTVPLGEPEYDDEYGLGLMGGVWPNLSAWIAVAVRDHDPDATATSLVTLSVPVLSDSPVQFGQVAPGAFPEWFSGAPDRPPLSLGMAASPWMPPTYTWAVVRGLLHLDHEDGQLSFGASLPPLPAGWSGWGVRRLPAGEHSVTVIRVGDVVYATRRIVGVEADVMLWDVTDEVTASARVVALADHTRLVVLADAPCEVEFRGERFRLEGTGSTCFGSFGLSN